MKRFKCENCGGELQQNGDTYSCSFCHATYRDDSIEKAYNRVYANLTSTVKELITEELVKERMEKIANCRQNLYKARTGVYIDAKKIGKWSDEILKLNPDDVQAAFYSIASKERWEELNKFVAGLNAREIDYCVPDFVDFLTNGRFVEECMLRMTDLIERAFQSGNKEYELCQTKIRKSAENERSGIFDEKLQRDVFVAYSSKDKAKAYELVEYLEKNGFSCFIAMRNLAKGVNAERLYNERLKSAIDNCRIFALVSSKNSRSRACDAFNIEMRYVRECDIKKSNDQNFASSRYELYLEKHRSKCKPRVEYLIEDYANGIYEQEVKKFFGGLTWQKTKDGVCKAVYDIIENSFGDDEDEILKRQNAEMQAEIDRLKQEQKRLEEEREREKIAEEKRKIEEEKRKIEDEKRRVEEEKLRQESAEKEKTATTPVNAEMEAALAYFREQQAKQKAEEEAKRQAEERAKKQETPKDEPPTSKQTANVSVNAEMEAALAYFREQQAKQKAEEDARRKAEEQKRLQEEETKRKAEEEKFLKEKVSQVTFRNLFGLCFGRYPQSLVEGLPEKHYKNEPIQWNIVQVQSGEALLIADQILDVAYHQGIKSWLKEFYEKAFTEKEKEIIKEAPFLLGKEDVEKYLKQEFNKTKVRTKYALGKGEDGEKIYDEWWLANTKKYIVGSTGHLFVEYGGSESKRKGIVPAIRIFMPRFTYEEEKALKAQGEKEIARRKAEEEAKWVVERKRFAEEETKRLAEEQRRKEEKKRKEEERKRLLAEEKKRQAEEAKRKAEEEARIRAEEETKRKAEEAAKRIAEEKERKEAERIRQAEEERKRLAEEAQKKQVAEELEKQKERGFVIVNGVLRAYTGKGGHVVIPDCVTSIGRGAFISCAKLTSVTIPDTVYSIGVNAFRECTGLTRIEIPNSVTVISDFAFYECKNLRGIVIPKSVTSIEQDAFFGCENLTIFAEATTKPRGWPSYSPEEVVWGYDAKKDPYFAQGFYIQNDTLKSYVGVESNVVIPNVVKFIGDSAFENCRNLTSVTIPNGASLIGDCAFKNCNQLTSVSLPNTVTDFGWGVFKDCSSLTSITLPKNLRSIGKWCFSNCRALTKVVIPLSVQFIDIEVFENCPSLTIYAETAKRPKGWVQPMFGKEKWNPLNRPVVWGHKEK